MKCKLVGSRCVAINDQIFQCSARITTGHAKSRPTKARAAKLLFRDGSLIASMLTLPQRSHGKVKALPENSELKRSSKSSEQAHSKFAVAVEAVVDIVMTPCS